MVQQYNDSIHCSLEVPEGGNGQPSPGVLPSAAREGTSFILTTFIHSHDMRMFGKGNKKLRQDISDDTQVSISSSRNMTKNISDVIQYIQDGQTDFSLPGCHVMVGLKKKGHFREENIVYQVTVNYGIKEKGVAQKIEKDFRWTDAINNVF